MQTKNKKTTAQTDFTARIHMVVENISSGHTRSYSAVASGQKTKSHLSSSVNFNPHIFCHRVIRCDDTLGGYNRGGETAKRAILERESNIINRVCL